LQTHNLIQGSQEWIDFRSTKFNASDAPAMLGLSSYKTRTQLLDEYKTGVTEEIDAATQKLFNDGHRFEAMAREIIEEEMDAELYPVVGSLDVFGLPLSASLDGMDMAETFLFEHKMLNKKLAALTSIDQLDKQYKVQMQQQMTISGCKKCLFVASNGTTEGRIKFWFKYDPDLEQEIINGWKQFAIDLENHVPTVLEVKKEAAIIGALPALTISVSGQVNDSNLVVYKESAIAFIDSINTDLKTDQDFANADATVKFCDKTEKELELVKTQALSQTADIDKLFRVIDELKEKMRSKRLTLDKLVTSEKQARRNEIVDAAQIELAEYVSGINTKLDVVYLPSNNADFHAAAKGKKTITSIQSSVNDELARVKIEVIKTTTLIDTNLVFIRKEAEEYKFLFRDLQQIILSEVEAFASIVKTRISDHKISEEERLEKIRLEEEAKVKAENELKAQQEEVKPVTATSSMPLPKAVPVLVPGGDKIPEIKPKAISPELYPDIAVWAKTNRISKKAVKELFEILNKVSDAA